MAKEILDRLRVGTACVRRVVWLIRHHMNFPAAKEVNVVKWLRHLAPEFKDRQELASAVAQLLTLREADLRGGKVRPEGRLAENERLRVLVADVLMRVPFYPADLALSGRVVARYLGEGPQVKRVLDDLLRRVQEGSLPNEAEALEKALSGTESYKRFLVHKENGRERRRV